MKEWVAVVMVLLSWAGMVMGAIVSGGGVGGASGDLPPFPQPPHRVVLDRDHSFVMLWLPQEEQIMIEIQVATRGWVGVGFSPNGGMKGADILLGWVDGGKVFLQDRYAEGYIVPAVDDSEDVTLIGGYENDTHTVIRFSRPWDTCDQRHDLQISEDTVRMIWSYSYEDPTSETTMSIHNRRGTKSIYLREPPLQTPALSPDVQAWDMRNDNVSLPDNLDTLYWCKLFKIPVTTKHHVIGFVPLIEEANQDLVHHIVLTKCTLKDSDKHYEKWLEVEGMQCHTPNMPVSWFHCMEPFIGWGIGGEGEMMPDHVGYPVGDEGPTYILMNMHYDNPNLKPGIMDNSGIRLYYTTKLREHDAGVLYVGHNVVANMIIPPGQEKWVTNSHCPEACTRQNIPKDGIKLFQGFLHSHLLGRSMILRHIRDGVELPPLMQDKNYDFNYQHTRILKEERTVLPGDSFFMECQYDSSAKTHPTFGGQGTQEEMCLAYMSYYPRTTFQGCISEPVDKNVFKALGIEGDLDVDPKLTKMMKSWGTNSLDAAKEEDQLQQILNGNITEPHLIDKSWHLRFLTAKGPERLANKTVLEILEDGNTWVDGVVTEALRDLVGDGRQKMVCVHDRQASLKVHSFFPRYEPLEQEPNQCRIDQE